MNKRTTSKIGQLDCTVVHDAQLETPQVAVIICHGFGASGEDLVSLADEFIVADPRLANTIYVFPAAPIMLDPGYDSRAWWMIDIEKIQQMMASGQTREMRRECPDRLPVCRKMIFEIIDHVKVQYSLPSDKIVVGGFSQGSMLSTDVALNYSEPLGGLLVWSGALICEKEWTLAAKKQRRLKIIQTHGNIDPILPAAGARDLHAMLQGAGHAIKYQEFSGPHTIPMVGLQLAAGLIAEVVAAD